MRLRDLTEAISRPPRTIHYFSKRRQELLATLQTIEQGQAVLKQVAANRDLVDDIDYALLRLDSTLSVDYLSYLARKFNSENSQRIAEYIDTYVRYHTDRAHGDSFLRHLYDKLKFTEQDQEKPRSDLQNLPHATETVAVLKTYQDGSLFNREYAEPGSVELAEQFCVALETLYPAMEKVIAIIREMIDKLDALYQRKARWGMHHNNRDEPPSHAPVETLYHATAFANEIVRDGFAAEMPDGRGGVGNFGRQDMISFTHDLHVAFNIMRCLKELAMIAHGQLKPAAIIDWMRREGIDTSPQSLYPHVETRAPLSQYTIEQTASLYNLYLWMTKSRYNPVFAGMKTTLRYLKDRSVNEIGVLACGVALNRKDYEYLDAEAEFRVPASAVQSIKRIA